MFQHDSHDSHHHAHPEEPVLTAPARSSTRSLSTENIAVRAYEKFLARGGTHGADVEDWTAAERELTVGLSKSPQALSRPV